MFVVPLLPLFSLVLVLLSISSLMSGKTGSRGRAGKSSASLTARTLRPSSVIPRDNSQLGDTPLDVPAGVDSAEPLSGTVTGEVVIPTPDAGLGSRRERSPTPPLAPSVPPSKRPRRRMSRGDDDDVEIVVSPSTADAYMRDSVPVFVENSAVRTPGPAPRTRAPSPGDNLCNVDDVYRRPSPGVGRPPAANSDEQQVITLTDSGLLQLFRAHGLDLDRRGTFLGCTTALSAFLYRCLVACRFL